MRHCLLVVGALGAVLAIGGCRSLPDRPPASPEAEHASQDDLAPLGVLETFLGHLAAGELEGAYELVAHSSKRNGDPIAYDAPLDYDSFLKELCPPGKAPWSGNGCQRTPDIRNKFKDYDLGESRWEDPKRFRAWVISS